jgi:hypothetical protein
MTLPNRQLFWIASPIKRKASTPPARASAAHSAVGGPGRKTYGLVPVVTNGTRSIRAGFVRPAFISGLKRSASHAVDGRRIPSGIRSDGTRPRIGTHCAFPESATVCGLLPASSATIIDSLNVPVVCGLKVTVRLQLLKAARLAPQPLAE